MVGLGVGAQEPGPGAPEDPEVFFSGPVIDGPDFCRNRSLGGQEAYALDTDSDGVADICSLFTTRREAVARQLAMERLARRQFGRFAELFGEECRNGAESYGESDGEGADACAPYRAGDQPALDAPPLVPALAATPGLLFSGPVIDGRYFCANFSLGGPRLYEFDADGDGVAETCSLYGTRRVTVARQFALERIANEQGGMFEGYFAQECEWVSNALGDSLGEGTDGCTSHLAPGAAPSQSSGAPGPQSGGFIPGGGGTQPDTNIPNQGTNPNIDDTGDNQGNTNTDDNQGNNNPRDVEVGFEFSSYTVDEGSSVTMTVELDVDPERTVAIPITASPESGASSADYSGVPTTVTFVSGETSKDITFLATADDDDDGGERVRLGIGSPLPNGVTEATTNESVISITDDDEPAPACMTTAGSFEKPQNVGVTGGDGKITVTWDSVTDAKCYDVWYRPNNQEYWLGGRSSDSPRVFRPLAAVTTYQVQVRAVAHDFNGPWSDIFEGTTSADIASPPVIANTGPISGAKNAFRVSWGHLTDGAYMYQAQYRVKGTQIWTIHPDTSQPGYYGMELKNLAYGTTYEVQIRGVSGDETGAWSASADAVTAPSESMLNLSADSSSSKLKVTWNSPFVSVFYRIEYRLTGSSYVEYDKWELEYTPVYSTTGAKSFTIDDTYSGAEYEFRIKATLTTTGNPSTGYSEIVTATTADS